MRRWTARVLVLWLLSVAVGIAQACLMPAAAGPHGLVTLAPAAEAGHPPAHGHDAAAAAPHGGDAAPAPHDGPGARSNCQDFCDKAAVSLPSLKSVLDDGHGAALPPPAIATAVPMPAPLPALPWVPRHADGPATPVAIAFLRLTR